MSLTKARYEARCIAEKIVRGEVTPYRGATAIWKQVLDPLDVRIPDDLWPFKSCASAIEDYLWNAEDCGSNHDIQIAKETDEIMRAAILLLQVNPKG